MTLTEKIKARLRVLFPKANLSTKRIDEISARLAKKLTDESEESAIDELLTAADDMLSFEDIAKQDDRERTLDAKVKELTKGDDNPDDKEKDKDKDNPDDKNLSQTDKLLKTLTETIGGLKTDIETIKSGKIIETKSQSVQALFDKSEALKGMKPEIKASWLKRVDLNSETPFEEQITALETEYAELVQVAADSADYGGRAIIGKPDAKFSQEAADKIVDNIL